MILDASGQFALRENAKVRERPLGLAVVRAGRASTVLLLLGSPRLAASTYHSSA